MGTGFTNTTALVVAPLGVSSVVALADDTLLEQQRQALSTRFGVEYQPIGPTDEDARARRTKAFLDLIADEVARRFEALRSASFAPDSPLHQYFSLLPESPLRTRWLSLSTVSSPDERARVEQELRAKMVPGEIEVNIMTKLDNAFTLNGVPKPVNHSDALASLRGFATSKLHSSVVMSAGLNQRLFAYAGTLDCFFPDAHGHFDKRLCLKVSDYRSADIQSVMLAKKGLWVSEFRIESGLNCGGHAFPTEGQLMGPILDDFRKNRAPLQEKLFGLLCQALRAQGRAVPASPPPIRITAQGGVGTALEHALLRERYGVDAVGWGSAFLFCPEVVAMDEYTLGKLLTATRREVCLSNSSPLGVPFWNLMTSKGEQAREARNKSGQSGSSCPRAILAFDTEFSDYPICTASRKYHIRLKESLRDAPAEHRQRRIEAAEAKSCLCGDLAGTAQICLGIDPNATPLVCPGPNSVYFRRVASFREMVDHIYGRGNVLPADTQRPHVFLNELELYVDYLEKECREGSTTAVRLKWLDRYRQALRGGIDHLRELAEKGWIASREEFLTTLTRLEARFGALCAQPSTGAATPSARD